MINQLMKRKTKQLFQGLLYCLFITACCTEKNSGDSKKITEPVMQDGVTLGKVSHQYKSTGCATVVIVNWQKPEEQIVLIPLDTLLSEFDVDGLEIYFNYQPLKRMNPQGCAVGFPALLSEISKK